MVHKKYFMKKRCCPEVVYSSSEDDDDIRACSSIKLTIIKVKTESVPCSEINFEDLDEDMLSLLSEVREARGENLPEMEVTASPKKVLEEKPVVKEGEILQEPVPEIGLVNFEDLDEDILSLLPEVREARGENLPEMEVTASPKKILEEKPVVKEREILQEPVPEIGLTDKN